LSESEFIEALNLHASNAMSGFAIYLTLTFAYLTAIYVVGGKLFRVQLSLLSLLYLIWSCSFVMVSVTHLRSMESLVQEYPSFIRSALWYAPFSIAGASITLAGMVICISYFLREIRAKEKEEGQ